MNHALLSVITNDMQPNAKVLHVASLFVSRNNQCTEVRSEMRRNAKLLNLKFTFQNPFIPLRKLLILLPVLHFNTTSDCCKIVYTAHFRLGYTSSCGYHGLRTRQRTIMYKKEMEAKFSIHLKIHWFIEKKESSTQDYMCVLNNSWMLFNCNLSNFGQRAYWYFSPSLFIFTYCGLILKPFDLL